MHYLICYDISENKIRRKVVNFLESVALRVQYSVFTCDVSDRQIRSVKNELTILTAKSKHALLLITPICHDCYSNLWKKGDFLEEPETLVIV